MGMFSDLPSDVMLDIFTRLPAECVVDCKSVSKTWNKVLRYPSFNQMHSNLLLSNLDSAADSGKLSYIFRMDDCSRPFSRNLYYLEYDDEISSHGVKKLKLKPPFELYSILGSCNGLVCINGLPSHYTMDESTSASYVAYICNPITGESITLPELDRSTYYDIVNFMTCGFGYVASTNEYKVVRIYAYWFHASKRQHEHIFAEIEVYTLGSGKGWRNVGKIRQNLNSMGRQHAVFVDGFLYWNCRNGRIVAFDLANEIFVELDEYYKEKFWFRVLGGHYCGTHYSEEGKSSDVWLLKKKEDETFSWSKESSLVNMDPYASSLALTSSGTVLCYTSTKLHVYDLKSSSSKMLEDFESFGRKIHHGVPHMNTLVSLKAFGEENTETGRSVRAVET